MRIFELISRTKRKKRVNAKYKPNEVIIKENQIYSIIKMFMYIFMFNIFLLKFVIYHQAVIVDVA